MAAVVVALFGVALTGLVSAGPASADDNPMNVTFTVSPKTTTQKPPVTLTFTIFITGGYGGPFQYDVNFGDGSAPASGTMTAGVTGTASLTLTHQFTGGPGSYTAVVSVVDNSPNIPVNPDDPLGGRFNNATATYTITPPPAFASGSVTPASGPVGTAVKFTADVWNDSSWPYDYVWNIFQGSAPVAKLTQSTSSQQWVTTYTFSQPGTYTASLTVADANGFIMSWPAQQIVITPTMSPSTSTTTTSQPPMPSPQMP